MKPNRATKIKALIAALVFTGALVLAEAKSAHANQAGGEGAVILLVVAGLATYATVLTTICTPVAAFKARDHVGGFGGAFKDCWNWRSDSQQPTSPEIGETEMIVAQEATENPGLQE